MIENTGTLIRSKNYIQQIRDFKGLYFGKISPTDIDAFLDFRDQIFIFIETKHGNTAIKTGQRLALERICDACERGGRTSLVLIASHNTTSDIDVAQLPVVQLRLYGEWRKPKKSLTIRQAIDNFLEWAKKKKS